MALAAVLVKPFLSDLADAWSDHGVEAIETGCQKRSGDVLQIVSNVLPKEVVQMAFSVNASIEFEDVEEARAYLAAYRRVRDRRYESPLIELNPEAEAAWRVDDDD